jgi:ubiquinone biosynthesis protein UbiJ
VIIDLLLPPVAALLNRGIHSRREAAELCEALVGRSFVTRIEGLPTGTLPIRVAASYEGIEIGVASDEQLAAADAVIGGTPLELRRLIFTERDASIRAGRLSFDGDIEVAEKFRDLLLTARPDLEGRLAAWIGEPAAFQLTSLFYDTQDWVMDLADEVVARSGEYLRDDARHVPTVDEAAEFCAAVDELDNDVDRLAARIERLRTAEASR